MQIEFFPEEAGVDTPPSPASPRVRPPLAPSAAGEDPDTEEEDLLEDDPTVVSAADGHCVDVAESVLEPVGVDEEEEEDVVEERVVEEAPRSGRRARFLFLIESNMRTL